MIEILKLFYPLVLFLYWFVYSFRFEKKIIFCYSFLLYLQHVHQIFLLYIESFFNFFNF